MTIPSKQNEQGALFIQKVGKEGTPPVLKVWLVNGEGSLYDLSIVAEKQSTVSEKLTGAKTLSRNGLFLYTDAFVINEDPSVEYERIFYKEGGGSVDVKLLGYTLSLSAAEIADIVLENSRRVKAAFADKYPTVNETVIREVTFYV